MDAGKRSQKVSVLRRKNHRRTYVHRENQISFLRAYWDVPVWSRRPKKQCGKYTEAVGKDGEPVGCPLIHCCLASVEEAACDGMRP